MHQQTQSRAQTGRKRSNALVQPRRAPTPILTSSDDDSEFEDDFPTPRANVVNDLFTSDCSSQASPASQFSCLEDGNRLSYSPCHGDIDVAYLEDADLDGHLIPFKISPSIKKTLEQQAEHTRPRPLSLTIPGDFGKTVQLGLAKHPIPLTPRALDSLSQAYVNGTKKRTAPSLDTSCKSLEIGSSTCPSTPVDDASEDEHEACEMPILLETAAFDVLRHLSLDPSETMCTPTQTMALFAKQNMQSQGPDAEEIAMSTSRKSGTEITDRSSAITVPSPAGFFKTLQPEAQQIWRFSLHHISPTTAIAEAFYGVSWRDEPLDEEAEAQRAILAANEGLPEVVPAMGVPVEDEEELYRDDALPEYDEDYEPRLLNDAQVNIDRTKTWLDTQEAWLQKRVLSMAVLKSLVSEGTLDDLAKVVGATSPSKQQQLEIAAGNEQAVKTPVTAIRVELPSRSESLAYHCFQRLFHESGRLDPLVLQHDRADTLENRRLYLQTAHLAQLRGIFTMKQQPRPRSEFFSSSQLPASPNDGVLAAQREAIIQADKERDMLDQLRPSVWYLQALRFIMGGTLLPLDALYQIRRKASWGQRPRVLVLGEQACASYGWGVAMECRIAKVYTATVTTQSSGCNWICHRGPSNHRTVTVANTTVLPFPDESFDVVKARTLHILLRDRGVSADNKNDYEATLAEIHRILVPGGVLQFSVMDAVPTAPTSTSIDTLAAKFSTALQDEGYDPSPTQILLPRLRQAGFRNIKRAWLSLPLGGGQSEHSVDDMAGLIGSTEWEKWMLRLQEEQGVPEEDLLKGVASALADARKCRSVGNAGTRPCWKILVGCARKS